MAEPAIKLESNNQPNSIIDMRPDVVVRVALLGLGLGVIAWAVTFLLDRFIISSTFCPASAQNCVEGDVISGNIALILAAIAGMLGLVRLGVYRPMLVAIAVGVSLWNIGGWLSGIVWYEGLGWSALIYMVVYVAFSWLVRPRNLFVVLAILAILIVAVRYISTL